MQDDNTTADVMLDMLASVLSGVNCIKTGIVTAVGGGLLTVTPLVGRKDNGGAVHAYSAIEGVPVLKLGGGGWEVDIEPRQGDVVLLLFSDSSIDEWKEDMTSTHDPEASRSHALSDAVALPLNFGAGVGGSISIRNTAGTVSAELSSEGITLTGNVDITGVLRVGTITPVSAVTVNAHTHIESGGGNTLPPTPG